MSCFRSAGLWISQRAPLKMTPSMPGLTPSFSRLSRYWSSSAAPSSGKQRLPAEFRRHDWRAVVGLFGELVRHLEEEQQRKLLDILKAGEPGVLQDAGIAPGPFADLRCVHYTSLWLLFFRLPALCCSTAGLWRRPIASRRRLSRARCSRSAAMRFRSSDAGSSFGSCGTSWPVKAWRRMDCRKRLGVFQLGIEVGFEVVDDGELVFDDFNNGLLLSHARDSHGSGSDVLKV